MITKKNLIITLLLISLVLSMTYVNFEHIEISLQGDNVFYTFNPKNEDLTYLTTIEQKYIFGSTLFNYQSKQYLGSLEGKDTGKNFEVNFLVQNIENELNYESINVISFNQENEASYIAYGLSLFYDKSNMPIFSTIISSLDGVLYKIIQFDITGNILTTHEIDKNLNKFLSVKDLSQINETHYFLLVSITQEDVTEFLGNYLLNYNLVLPDTSAFLQLEKYVSSVTFNNDSKVIFTTSLDRDNLQERSIYGIQNNFYRIGLTEIRVKQAFNDDLLIIKYKQVTENPFFPIILLLLGMVVILFFYLKSKR